MKLYLIVSTDTELFYTNASPKRNLNIGNKHSGLFINFRGVITECLFIEKLCRQKSDKNLSPQIGESVNSQESYSFSFLTNFLIWFIKSQKPARD